MKTVNAQELNEILKGAQVPVIVDCFADWCSICKTQATVLGKLAKQLEGKAIIVGVDVGKETALAEKYNIAGVPVILCFKNRKRTARLTGFQPAKDVIKLI